MRLLFVLPGFHRYERGAEVALLSLAREFAEGGEQVTVIGSGQPGDNDPYKFIHSGSIRRENFERFPFFAPLRSETVYEELSFVFGLALKYRPADFDAVITCSFPFTNLMLRRPVLGGKKPLQIFVTQNGDWPARSDDSEYRLFSCDGLVCTNPDYYEHNKDRWPCTTIPNGIPVDRFRPGSGDRKKFGFPENKKIVLMVSAMIPTKRVSDGIRSVAQIPDAHLVVAGDGPLRDEVRSLADDKLSGRFTQLTVSPDEMPALYQSADVFLHMSKLESFGNVFPEAMACGLPIVGHDTPRLRWIVGDDEYLVDTEKPETVAAALSEALAEGAEAQAGRSKLAARFAWENVAAQYRDFFEELVRKRP